MVNLSITYTLSRIPCFRLGLVFLQPSLFLVKVVWAQSKICNEAMSMGAQSSILTGWRWGFGNKPLKGYPCTNSNRKKIGPGYK